MKPDDGYIEYIANPKSGATSGKLVWSRFEKYLMKKGYEVRVNLTKSLSHACELAVGAAKDPDCAMVVAIGGDGTIREVAHGLIYPKTLRKLSIWAAEPGFRDS